MSAFAENNTSGAAKKPKVFNGSRINKVSIIQSPVHQSGKKRENPFMEAAVSKPGV
jgi:hypothetical protein